MRATNLPDSNKTQNYRNQDSDGNWASVSLTTTFYQLRFVFFLITQVLSLSVVSLPLCLPEPAANYFPLNHLSIPALVSFYSPHPLFLQARSAPALSITWPTWYFLPCSPLSAEQLSERLSSHRCVLDLWWAPDTFLFTPSCKQGFNKFSLKGFSE